ncbi:MAG TPA: DUF167 domain-containing protein, partial [Acidimicrobiales bacterium]|nr:DUF167 domain-containing protein [Acidimicrobiales bacterium]
AGSGGRGPKDPGARRRGVDELYMPAGDDAVVLSVHVQPGAGRTAVVGRHGTALKIRVAAPPEGGRANDACAALLSETFGTAQVELVGGGGSRSKRYRLEGVDGDEFRRRLERAVAEGAPGQGPGNRQTGLR